MALDSRALVLPKLVINKIGYIHVVQNNALSHRRNGTRESVVPKTKRSWISWTLLCCESFHTFKSARTFLGASLTHSLLEPAGCSTIVQHSRRHIGNDVCSLLSLQIICMSCMGLRDCSCHIAIVILCSYLHRSNANLSHSRVNAFLSWSRVLKLCQSYAGRPLGWLRISWYGKSGQLFDTAILGVLAET